MINYEKGLLFYKSWIDYAMSLKNEKNSYKDFGDYVYGIFQYFEEGKIDDNNSMKGLIIGNVAGNIDAAKRHYENGKKGGKPSKVDHTRAIDLKNEGKTNKEIAIELKTTEANIRAIISRENRKNTNIID